MSEDQVVEAVRELVAAGEYLDTIPGTPGARLEGGGVFQDNRRLYTRGSPEFLEARGAGLIEKLPPLVPATPGAVAEAERALGYSLPRLLRRLYLEVGNGGFGPGYGILGVRDGFTDDVGDTALDAYRRFHSWRRELSMPDSLLPICHWGCAIYSLVDCASADAEMWACDPNPGLDDDVFRQETTLIEWLQRWVDGCLYQPALFEDPETGVVRPATDDDFARWEAENDEP
jgi:hypothetical protein